MDVEVVAFVVEGDMCAPGESDDGTYVGAKVGKYVVGASVDKVADGKFVGASVEEAEDGRFVGDLVDNKVGDGNAAVPLLSLSYAQS